MTNLIRNVSYDQSEIIRNILRLHVPGEKIDCDPTYSIGAFYRGTGIDTPALRFDIHPQAEGVVKADARKLPVEDNSISCMMFDPPFLATAGKSLTEGKGNLINRRFGVFPNEQYGSVRYMSERINTPFTNEHFVAFLKKMVGHPYWYGTCLYPCTESTLKSKSKQYPDHYGSSRMAQYRRDIANKDVASDCVGGCKGYAWTNGGIGVLEAIGTGKSYTRKSGSNGCPDKSANGMFEYAKKKGMDWGVISTIPEIPGLAVRKDGHVGYYIGNGEVVEWMGFSYGCKKTKLKSRPWTHWYKLPFIDYNDGATTAPVQESTEYVLGSRQLVEGSNGSDVKAMQELLIQLGYKLPRYGADGDFGSETLTALTAFQKDHGVKADGKYGEETHKALMDAVADDDEGKKAEAPTVEEPVITTGPQVEIVASQGGKVNIRVGNSTAYARITTVAAGTRLPYIATAENGWMAVVVGAQIGWVSPKYSKRV